MNTRALSIIKILLNSVEPVSSLALSQEIGCSTKTIQNEIKEVNKELKNCEIVSIRGIGYKIEGNLDDIDIKNSDLYDYDRVEYIIKKIINISSTDKDTIKLEDLADSMYVSLSTVKNDLKEVKKILNEYNLKISSKHKQGICIEASEEDIIKFIINYSNKVDNSLSIKDFLNNNIIENLFSIKKILLDTLSYENMILTDNEFKNIVNYISIYLSRNNTNQSDFIKEYIKKYKNKKEKPISEDEQLLIRKAIKEFCRDLNIATSINLSHDKVFEECLFNHISNLYKRADLGINQYEITAGEIKLKYPFPFELGKIAKKTIEKNLNMEISEDEVENIALHIGGALERIDKRDEKKVYKTIIVCTSGVGTSMLIKSKLENIFKGKLEIIKVIPSYLIDYVNVLDIDFVISTVEVNLENVNVIKVSPMLTDKEIKLIEKYIETENVYIDLDIQNLFSSELFFKDIKAETRSQVIDIMSKKLVEKGYIDDTMRQSYFERETIATTEIGNMVAIPHGAKGEVYENKVAIGILKEPISWEVGKVRLVIMLALDKEKILDYEEVFSKIYKRVDSIAKVISICENKSYEKFIKLFK
ncbi:MAG: PTS sugar transporter subunit IIA [Romboutsia timonensis]|uniref:BglG family transcription antiterminator n=1 Tax=Romboutsia timonensis TaxID=1776391 RepID=UPI002A751D21|nr:PTS sugar transporter subunit IIA [Romboutsia timonensis]MDY2881463.1 PTS sugar transporter subunit IIA [Romboutsia timonensis]